MKQHQLTQIDTILQMDYQNGVQQLCNHKALHTKFLV
jgi:hypothetical protein